MTLEKILGKKEKSTTFVETNDLINHPFYEQNYHNLFKQDEWQIIELKNDFFIEENNFILIKLLLTINNENYFFAADAHSLSNDLMWLLNININLDKTRLLLKDNHYFTLDWYLIGYNKQWACVSIADESSLFIGYKKDLIFDEIVKSSENFIRFL